MYSRRNGLAHGKACTAGFAHGRGKASGKSGVLHPAFLGGDYSCLTVQTILLLIVGA